MIDQTITFSHVLNIFLVVFSEGLSYHVPHIVFGCLPLQTKLKTKLKSTPDVSDLLI